VFGGAGPALEAQVELVGLEVQVRDRLALKHAHHHLGPWAEAKKGPRQQSTAQ
jgi:hypothetical protein